MGTVTDGANGMRPGRGSALILARLVTYAPVAGPSAEHAAPCDPRCRQAGTMTGTDPKQTEGRGSASSMLLIVFQSVSFSLQAFRPHRRPAAAFPPLCFCLALLRLTRSTSHVPPLPFIPTAAPFHSH